MKKIVLAVLVLGLSYSNAFAKWVLTHHQNKRGSDLRIEALGFYYTAEACLEARTFHISRMVDSYRGLPLRVHVNENYIFTDSKYESTVDKLFCIKE